MKRNRDGSVATNNSALGISTNKAAMMRYAPYDSRKNTYSRWLTTNALRPEPLCEAGKESLIDICCDFLAAKSKGYLQMLLVMCM